MNTIRRTLTRLAAGAAIVASLGIAAAGTASAQMALNDPDFQAPYSVPAGSDTDSVRIHSQIQGVTLGSQAQGVFLGMQVR